MILKIMHFSKLKLLINILLFIILIFSSRALAHCQSVDRFLREQHKHKINITHAQDHIKLYIDMYRLLLLFLKNVFVSKEFSCIDRLWLDDKVILSSVDLSWYLIG